VAETANHRPSQVFSHYDIVPATSARAVQKHSRTASWPTHRDRHSLVSTHRKGTAIPSPSLYIRAHFPHLHDSLRLRRTELQDAYCRQQECNAGELPIIALSCTLLSCSAQNSNLLFTGPAMVMSMTRGSLGLTSDHTHP
jgi:hypothetical protein